MSDVALYLDQDNELLFNVSIEGSKPGTPKYRLVFEGKDMSYTFLGRQMNPGEVAFTVPTMKNLIREGSYKANLEVVIDDRYFVPLNFDAHFEESVSVKAEALSRPVQKKPAVTASIAKSSSTTILESAQSVQQKQKFVNEVSANAKNDRNITVDDLRALIRART